MQAPSFSSLLGRNSTENSLKQGHKSANLTLQQEMLSGCCLQETIYPRTGLWEPIHKRQWETNNCFVLYFEKQRALLLRIVNTTMIGCWWLLTMVSAFNHCLCLTLSQKEMNNLVWFPLKEVTVCRRFLRAFKIRDICDSEEFAKITSSEQFKEYLPSYPVFLGQIVREIQAFKVVWFSTENGYF